MENNASELKNFIGKIGADQSLQDEFRKYMGKTMQGMDGDIMTMQKAMNAKIAQGFTGFARENGFEIGDDEMDALLQSVSEGLHHKMGAIFREQFAEAIGKFMKG